MMAQDQVKIVKDGYVAEVAPTSTRVWLDKGWKLVEERAAEDIEATDTPEVQTDGAPTVEVPEGSEAPDPVQQPVRQSPRATAPPTGPGQEA